LKTLRKVIKKLFRGLLWTTGVIVVLLVAGYFALRDPAVQTWLSQRAAAYLSDELGTTVRVGGVDIEFFRKIVLEDVYIEDLHKDTLLDAERLKVDIRTFSYGQRYLDIGDISLVNTKVKVKKYKGERGLNYRFLEEYFASADTSTKPKSARPWKVNLGGVTLTNVDVAYIDTRDTSKSRGMDYGDLRISHINAKLANIEQKDTTTAFNVLYLSAQEKSGFVLRNMSSHLVITPTQLQFDNLGIRTPESTINGFIGFRYATFDDFEDDFEHKVDMDGHFYNTSLEMADLKFFAPELKGIRKRIYLSGDIKGKVDRLRCKDIEIRFGERSRLSGDFSFNGLPDIEQTNMSIKLTDLVTNKKDIEGIPLPPFESGKYVQVPEGFAQLGEMHFKGRFDGFTHEFVAHGECRTAIGNIVLKDFALVDNGEGKPVTFEGRQLIADNFNIGRYLGIPDLGRVTATVKVKGSGLKAESMSSHLEGTVNSLEFKGYSYRNMDVRGELARRNFKGNLSVHDENIDMEFSGNVNFAGKLPVMNFEAQIDKAKLAKLNLVETKDSINITAHTVFSLTGDDIDNLRGTATITDLRYTRNKELYTMKKMELQATETNGVRRMVLNSDIVMAEVKGRYMLKDLPASVTELFSQYLPAYFTARQSKKPLPEQKFEYSIDFRDSTRVMEVLLPGIAIAPGTHILGDFDSTRDTAYLEFDADSLVYEKKKFDKIDVTGRFGPKNARFTGKIKRAQLTDSLWLGNIDLWRARASYDSLTFGLRWDNKTAKANKGDLGARLFFRGTSSFDILLRSFKITLEDSVWTADRGGLVEIDSNRVEVKSLVLRSGTQSVSVQGVMAENMTDQLYADLKNFNLNIVNRFTGSALATRGTVDGRVSVSDIYRTKVFNSNLDFRNLIVNKQGIGDGTINASWDPKKEAVYMNGSFEKSLSDKTKIENLRFFGHYYPKREENSLDLELTAKTMDLAMFAPYVKEYCSIFAGQYSGDVTIKGTPSKPVLGGEIWVNVKKIHIDFLNTFITAETQKIVVEENAFSIENFRVADPHGNAAIARGHLYHDHLSKFQLDFDMELKQFQVMNTTPRESELYYGTLFATGFVNFSGFTDNVRIDAEIATDKTVVNTGRNRNVLYSNFNIPMEKVQEVNEHDFITFKRDTTEDKDRFKLKHTGVTIDMFITATPDCEVKVIFDPKVGDEIAARGNGDLRMRVSPDGDFKLFGQYRVTSGTYLFTLKNLVNKPFTLDEGGTINWAGDPYKAEVNMTATYNVTTSVKPFFPYDSLEIYRRQYPVETKLILTGDLMRPDITFDVQLPTADQNVQEGIARFLQTEEERNKQVFALLVMNSFITPQEYRDLGYSAGSNNAFASTGSELLSAQISNWLSQISKEFDLGVKYRPNDELSKEELRVYMGTQVLDDRLTINGNLGVVNQSTNNVVGDVNVEYKLTDDGKVRLKAFNRSVDNTLNTSGATFSQGVGVFYREDFDTFGELYRRYLEFLKRENPNRQREKPVLTPVEPAEPPKE